METTMNVLWIISQLFTMDTLQVCAWFSSYVLIFCSVDNHLKVSFTSFFSSNLDHASVWMWFKNNIFFCFCNFYSDIW